MTATELLDRLQGVQKNAKGWVAFCPGHADRKRRSLSVSQNGTSLLLHCFTGCPPATVMAALGLTVRDLFLDGVGTAAVPERRIVATYEYHDEAGQLLYTVVRFEPKDFRPRLPDGTWGLGTTRRVLYRLPLLTGHRDLFLVEGEKDADALAATGLAATTSPGGANGWRPEYAEQLARLTPERVLIVPDNDAPGRAYAETAARSLLALGVEVRIVILPGLRDKADASDWLAGGGTGTALAVLAAESPVFTPPAAPPDEPALRVIGDGLWVVWPSRGLTMEFSRFVDHRDTLMAEISVTSEQAGALHWAKLNLASTQTRTALVRVLEEAESSQPWRSLVEAACRMVVDHWRAGEPATALRPAAPSAGRWLVEPYVPLGEITVLFGDGGAGKSLLALALALAGLIGHPLGNLWRIQPLRRVLYLDWESDAQAHAERLWALSQPLEAPPEGAILHRRLYRPLTEDLSTIRADCDRHEADLVVVDSLGAACGPEPEGADAAVRTLMAIRGLRGTKLVVAHVSKQGADTKGPARPFGSVYVGNLARSTIEFRRQEEGGAGDDGFAVTLYHRKNNHGRLGRAAGFAFEWGIDGALAVRRAEPDLSSTSLATRVLASLRSGGMAADAIADELDVPARSVKSALARLDQQQKVTRLESVSGGRGNKTLWGLRLESDSGHLGN